MPAQGPPSKYANERQQEILALFENPHRTMSLLTQGRILFGGTLSQFGWMWTILPLLGVWGIVFDSEQKSDKSPLLLVGVFLLIGIGLIFVDLRKNIQSLALLQSGSLAIGRLKRAFRTTTKVNRRRVYEYQFGFIASDGIAYDTILRTHRSDLVEDEGQELILYNPNNPKEAVVFDTIPGKPLLNPRGTIEVDSPLLSLACLFFPSINFLIILRMFFWFAQ